MTAGESKSVSTPAEIEATGDGITVAIADEKITVPPVKKWKSSAMRAMNMGDFDTWAAKTLSADDYATWVDLDPTIGEVEEMFIELKPQLGTSSGNSRASRR